jgi:hypothetical protein
VRLQGPAKAILCLQRVFRWEEEVLGTDRHVCSFLSCQLLLLLDSLLLDLASTFFSRPSKKRGRCSHQALSLNRSNATPMEEPVKKAGVEAGASTMPPPNAEVGSTTREATVPPLQHTPSREAYPMRGMEGAPARVEIAAGSQAVLGDRELVVMAGSASGGPSYEESL